MIDVVDAHHHLCNLRNSSYPWLEGPSVARYHGNDRPLRRDYLVSDYLRDTAELEALDAQLVGSVHIENGAADPLAEANWVHGIIASHAVPSVQVAKVDLTHVAAADQIIQLAAIPSMRGVRDILNWHPDPLYTHRDRNDLMASPDWRRGFAELVATGLSFDLQVFPTQLGEAAGLAADFPDTSIVLDHAGMPIDRTDDGLHYWRTGMRRVAERPNTTVKISALGTNDHSWTRDSIRRIVLETIEVFGPERTMFGSNFPVDGLYSTFGDLYAAFFDITSGCTDQERSQLFGGTARKFYRI